MSARPTSAMVLAAGRGERMRPLTDSTPKPLLDVGGKPLVHHALARIRAAGIARAVVNTSWLPEQLHAALGDGARFGLALEFSDEGPVALETGGGIRRALARLSDPFLVVNGDVYCDADLGALALAEGDLAQLLLVDNPPHHPRGDFVLAAGRLAAPVDAGAPRLTYSGIGVYRHALFAGQADGRFPLAPLLIAAMAAGRVGGQRHGGIWSDVGTPERLAELDRRLAAAPQGGAQPIK